MRRGIIGAAVVLALFPAAAAQGAVFCPDDRVEMPIQTTLPWSAVGFLNNGCTATLIDSEHIQAGAHCFVFPNTGVWQNGPEGTGLRFYPNYNPSGIFRVPPYAEVDRVVVGSRTEGPGFPPPQFPAMDWGIAHLATPITDYAPLPVRPVPSTPWPVMNAGYPRYPDLYSPSPVWPQPPEPATTCGNCWWIPATVDPACEIVAIENHVVQASCSGMGGSSGSPFIWRKKTLNRTHYYVGGSVFGSWDPLPGGCEDFTLPRATIGPTAESYRYAPRLAQGVALAAGVRKSAFGRTTRKTLLFASDTDSDAVAVRSRAGTSFSKPFAPFAPFGSVPDPVRVAALNYPTGPYQVFATTAAGELWGRKQGRGWGRIATPDGAGALDVDTLYNTKGTDRLFLVTDGGQAFTRRFSGITRQAWSALPDAGEPYTRVSAVDLGRGRARVFLATAGGHVYVTQEAARGGGGWTVPELFGGPPDMPEVVDLDAAWAVDAPRTRVFAVDAAGEVWLREALGGGAAAGWKGWVALSSNLLAPQAPGRPAPEHLVSITAGHWQETTVGGPRPVIFATDDWGNIYYAEEYLLLGADGEVISGWSWLSFYHY